MSSQTIINLRKNLVLLISEDDVKLYTPLSPNKVQQSIAQYILLAQETILKDILGPTIYDVLITQWVIAGSDPSLLPTIDGINYSTLYDELYKSLIWNSYKIALPHIAIRVEETGIMLNDTDWSENAGMVGLNRLVSEAEYISRKYTQDFKDYFYETYPKDSDESKDFNGEGINTIGVFVPKYKRKNCE